MLVDAEILQTWIAGRMKYFLYKKRYVQNYAGIIGQKHWKNKTVDEKCMHVGSMLGGGVREKVYVYLLFVGRH